MKKHIEGVSHNTTVDLDTIKSYIVRATCFDLYWSPSGPLEIEIQGLSAFLMRYWIPNAYRIKCRIVKYICFYIQQFVWQHSCHTNCETVVMSHKLLYVKTHILHNSAFNPISIWDPTMH